MKLSHSIRSIQRIAGKSVARQILAGIISVAALGYAVTLTSMKEYAEFSENIIFSGLLASIFGLPFYPAIYKKLCESHSIRDCIRFLAILFPAFFLGAILTALVTKTGERDAIPIAATTAAMLVAGILPAFSLGVEKYTLYNVGELASPVISALLIVIFRPTTSVTITYCISAGYAMKILIYLPLIISGFSTSNGKKIDVVQSAIEGIKVGIVGAGNSIVIRSISLGMGTHLSPATSQAFLAAWPFAEKLLILPQAINAIMYGVIKKGAEQHRIFRIYVQTVLAMAIAAAAISLTGFLFEKFILDPVYQGLSSGAILALSICFFHGLRVLSSTVLAASEKSFTAIKDTCIVLIANHSLTYFSGLHALSIGYYYSTIFIIIVSAIFLVASANSSIKTRESHL